MADDDRRELRGTVEHVGSGRRDVFRDSRELVAFLETDHTHGAHTTPQPKEAER